MSRTLKMKIAGGRAKRRLRGAMVAPRLGLSRRSRTFRGRKQDRFWWYQLTNTDYVPPIFSTLSRREWQVMKSWYRDSERVKGIGEINVPAMSMLQGLVMGNGVTRTVELGHYYGYSTLLTGFMLRAMNNGGKMVSIDIDPKANAFTEKWIERAGLTEQCSLYLSDSSDEKALDFAVERLGGMPELILLDSSHQFDHTLKELDLWIPRMEPNTIMLLHDTSNFARDWDGTGKGGVQEALDKWLPKHPELEFINLNRQVELNRGNDGLVYKDGCGIGILQVRGAK